MPFVTFEFVHPLAPLFGFIFLRDQSIKALPTFHLSASCEVIPKLQFSTPSHSSAVKDTFSVIYFMSSKRGEEKIFSEIAPVGKNNFR